MIAIKWHGKTFELNVQTPCEIRAESSLVNTVSKSGYRLLQSCSSRNCILAALWYRTFRTLAPRMRIEVNYATFDGSGIDVFPK